MSANIPFRKIKRKLKHLGIEGVFTSNGYYKISRLVKGKRCSYAIPLVSGRFVKSGYIRDIKNRLHITDREWEDA